MRILKDDHRNGAIAIRLDSPDDLWVLRTIIVPGDELRGSTERKLKIGSGHDEKSSVVRKRMTLQVKIEKVEYDGAQLRALGTITDGPEDVPRGEHHSFGLEQGSEIKIIKDHWPAHLRTKLEEATRPNGAILVVLFDREEAKLYSVTRRGIDEITQLRGRVAKKALDEKQTANFYTEIVAEIQSRVAHFRHVVAGAPAFWREYLEKELPSDLRAITVMTTISAVEKTAIRELLVRPEVQKLLRESATLREMALVEEVLEALAKDRLAYGAADLREAIASANISKLVITERAIAAAREGGGDLENLMRDAEAVRAEIHVLAGDEAQSKLDAFGGAVGMRRW